MNKSRSEQPIPHPLCIALAGPTACGKSEIAIELFKKLCKNAYEPEIISADSMLVYQGMNIGTAKPTQETLNAYPHHMIDKVKPTENYNVSIYVKEASEILNSLLQKNKSIIATGGTGLYLKALVDGLNEAPTSDPEIRSLLETQSRENGPQYLYEKLLKIDPPAAEKIHPNNTRRVIRALEVFEISGKPFSQFHKEQSTPTWKEQFKWLGITRDRKDLDQRIQDRTVKMFNLGLVEEVKSLLEKGCNAQCTSMQGLGYKEVMDGLKKGHSESEMIDLIAQRTRRYARRQWTWWRVENRINWYEINSEQTSKFVVHEILQAILPKIGENNTLGHL